MIGTAIAEMESLADSVAATVLVGEGVRYDEVRELLKSGRE